MAGQTYGQPSGSRPHGDSSNPLVQHVTRDRVQLYADRVESPSARDAAALRARAEAMLSQQGVVRFGRQPARRAMRSKRAVVASALATTTMLLGGGAALASGAGGNVTYTVVTGDTLSELAERYETTVADLARVNNIADPDLIVVGDELDMSVAVASPSVYTVVEGDTLEDIAWANDVTVQDLIALNNLDNPDLLQIGQQLLLPDRVAPVAAAPADGASADDGTDVSAPVDVATPVDAATPADDGGVDPSTITGESGADAGADSVPSDGEPTASDAAPAVTETPAPVASGSATLHLVLPGETLDSIAALYNVSVDQLVAANARAVDGVSSGMILKIPSAELSGIQLVGMPVTTEADAASAEAAAVEVATGYWAAPITQDEVLAQLPVSDNPHEGYLDGYGVYAEPLASLLERYGFHSGVFYGDTSTLTAQLDSGIPVIAWVTQDMQVSDLAPYTDGTTDFNLAPDKQAVVVYGYDESGVFIVDVSDGQYKRVAWEDFQRSWDAFGDMALAVVPI